MAIDGGLKFLVHKIVTNVRTPPYKRSINRLDAHTFCRLTSTVHNEASSILLLFA